MPPAIKFATDSSNYDLQDITMESPWTYWGQPFLWRLLNAIFRLIHNCGGCIRRVVSPFLYTAQVPGSSQAAEGAVSSPTAGHATWVMTPSSHPPATVPSATLPTIHPTPSVTASGQDAPSVLTGGDLEGYVLIWEIPMVEIELFFKH